ESRAQMATLPRMKPRCFYDLVVEVAIIRPGPIVGQMVHPFLARRAGREPVTYPHPSLEPILRRTLGVPLFQEQLLRIAMTAAGFTGGEAEELRRAMGFKRSEERMRSIEAKLRRGLHANGIEGEGAEEIVRAITSFALYGFPESHAASFALIAWASAWLKAHHPAAFACSLLNAWPMGFYHPSTLVKDAQRHGVEVRPIDVRRSHWRSTLEPGERSAGAGEGSRRPPPAVRLGLRFVRGLREESARGIVEARAQAPWRDVSDLSARTGLSRREISTLAEVGALDGLVASPARAARRTALWQVAALPRPDQRLLAGLPVAPGGEDAFPEMSGLETTLADYRASGVTTGPQVMGHLREDLRRRGILSLADLARRADGDRVRSAGLVIVRQRPGTAKGICFLTLEDETGLGNAVLMPDVFERVRRTLAASAMLVLEGTVERRDGVVHLRVEEILPIAGRAEAPPSHDFH
ncbi:error-prone DNA polymerase, partial [bacterium]|nr:error-prone DNA polymerase [bacterium]